MGTYFHTVKKKCQHFLVEKKNKREKKKNQFLKNYVLFLFKIIYKCTRSMVKST